MNKKILLTCVVSCFVALAMTGCGKKDAAEDGPPIVAESTDAANRPDLNAANPVDVSSIVFGSGVDKGEATAIVNQLTGKYPGITITKVDVAPVAGFYQIVAGGDILYITKSGEHMFVGDLLAINKPVQENLTENVRKTTRKALLDQISEEDMVIYTPKSGDYDYTVTVFTDIDCGYCRKFHSEMAQYLDNNIRVRYLSFPRAGKYDRRNPSELSASYKKAKTVWCSADRNKAMDSAKSGSDDFKFDGELCDTQSVDKSMALVSKFGINGTPALVLDDGTVLPGYMPAKALRAALDSNKERQQASSSSSEAPKTRG